MPRKKNEKFLNNNENLPIKIDIDYTPEQIEEIRKCKEDIVYFAENYFFIRVLGKGRQKIKLFDAQKRIIRKIVNNRRTIICASRQTGKALALDTPIPTPSGWKNMGDIKDGDIIFDGYGNPTTVTHAHDIMYDRPCYEIEFSNGEKIIADEEHQWWTQSRTERKYGKEGSVKTTKQLLDTLTVGQKNKEPNHRIPYNNVIQYPESDLPIDPYLFGYWLGDGCSKGQRITVGSQDIDEFITKRISHIQNKRVLTYDKRNIFYVSILKDENNVSFVEKLKNLEVFGNKHIPNVYLHNSYENRLAILQGIVDSDGHVDSRGAVEISTISYKFSQSIKELLNSLGIQCGIKEKIPTINGKKCNKVYRICFKTSLPVCQYERKLKKIKPNLSSIARNKFVYIKNITKINSVPVRCLTVDNPEHLYLAGKTFIPTHNSTIMTVVCLWYALFRKDYEVAILANKEVQAKEILDRIKLAYEEIDNFLKAGVWTFSQEIIRLTNGSKIYVSTTSLTSLRGKSVDMLFVDEFAFVPPEVADGFFKSVVPVLASGNETKMIVTSTPNGANGKFYELFSNAETGRSTTWVWDKMYWYEIPGRDENWKKDQLDAIGYDMHMWDQEYDILFLEDGSSAVNLAVIERMKKKCRNPDHSFDGGEYKIWHDPQPDHIYVVGVDAAQGVGQDWSVAQIFDITNPTEIFQVGQYAVNYLQPYVFAEKLNQIIRSWGRPFVCIESNSDGVAVLEALINVHKYDNIVTWNMKNDKRGYYQKPGIFCHQNSKNTGINNMKYFIEHLECVTIYDIQTLKEFETFIRKENKTWTAQKGKHDDRVMSVIWSLIILEKEIAEQYLDVLEYDDAGKPLRIADPNQDFANMSFYEPESYSSYAKLGGNPLPTMFHIGGGHISTQTEDLQSYMMNGWSIV